MSRRFVYADPHFGHASIITYAQRPWVSVDKMDADLVKLYNSVVGKDDLVYWLGDVTLRGPDKKGWLARILGKMNGRKVLVFGNHDDWHWQHYLDVGFQSAHTFLEFQDPAIRESEYRGIRLCHDPAWAQDKNYLWIVGHLHNCAFTAPYHIAVVSVELTDYKPVPIELIAYGERPGAGVLRTGPRENRTPKEWGDG
jgi:calcineurin-like phosphoesterase family protein